MHRSKYVDSYSRGSRTRELRHSGEVARKWRRQLAALSNAQEAIKTFKFPLELPQGCVIDFEQAARLYDVVEGVGKGSLIGLLCAVHLSGFRLFSSNRLATTFRNQARYPSREFATALNATFGIVTTPKLKLTPADLDVFVTTRPRKRQGTEVPFDRDSMTERLYAAWVGKKPNDKADTVLLEIAKGMAEALCKAFNSWEEMTGNPKEALAKIESYLQSKGDFPSLPSPSNKERSRTEAAVIAFDPDSTHIDIDESDQEESFLVHRALAVAARALRRDNPQWDTGENAKALQDTFLSRSDNALSWLFGTGWKFLHEKPVEKIAENFGVPVDRIASVQQLKRFADEVPEPPFFAMKHYADFRKSVSGKLRSWIANYQKRLEELKSLSSNPPAISDLPEELKEKKAAVLFYRKDIEADALFELKERFCRNDSSIEQAIAKLAGDSDDIPTREDIKAIEQFSAERGSFVALVNQVNNMSSQKTEGADTDDEKAFWKKCNITLPKEMKELPKLNQISGGSVNAEQETKSIEEQLNSLLDAQNKHFAKLINWMDEQSYNLSPVSNLIKQEEQKMKENENLEKAEELGWRRFLNKIAQEGRLLSEANRRQMRDWMLPIFLSVDENQPDRGRKRGKANCNKFFFNHQGRLYRSPYSTSRHRAYDIDLDRAKQKDWLADIKQLIQKIEEKLTKVEGHLAAEFRDWLRMRNLYFSLQLQALPEAKIPANWSKLPDSISGYMEVPPLLAAQTRDETVSKSVCLRLFNLYSSKLNGLCFQVLRESFIVRAKFHRIGQDKLLYVPKVKPWKAPDRLGKTDKPIASAIKEAMRNPNNIIEPINTLKQFFTEKEGESFAKANREALHAYLAQAPHDWYFPADFGSDISKTPGIEMKKNNNKLINKFSEKTMKPGLRLQGSSSFKNRLDRALLGKTEVKEATLIIDYSHKQRFSWKDGQVSLDIRPQKARLDLAVPITEKTTHGQLDKTIFDRILTIDLGEKRIGYAVFDIRAYLKNGETPQPAEDDKGPIVGTVAIPSIRRLMAKVRTHRGRHQPNQKMQQTYSKALEKYRESVIGDVCNRIETLCHRYNAFPVLESDIENLESGGRQLQTIYGSILHLYTYSEVDAHKEKRADHWFVKGAWQHPYLVEYSYDAERCERTKNESKNKSLNLFPGVKVSAAGTSQTCSKCERNSLAILRKGSEQLEVKENGKIEIEDGVIQLRKKEIKEGKWKELRRKNERPQFKDYASLDPGSYPAEELRKLAKFHQRQAPRSKQSSDTTQSRYHCLYVGCGYEGHADENAAINIGRRFFERIAREQSRKKLDKLTKTGKSG